MGCRIDENLLVKLWRKPNVEAAFESNLWFFAFNFADFQIIVHSNLEIVKKFLGAFVFVRDKGRIPMILP